MVKKAPAPTGLVQSNVRMPQPALDYLDEWVARLNHAAGWAKHTRSDLIRDLVLDAIERDLAETRARGERQVTARESAEDRILELTEEEAGRRGTRR